MDERYWSAVATVRLRIAGLLESLSPDEWDVASLCRGWRVRDVAGHLALVPTITTWQLLAAAPRVRFDLNRVNTLLAVRAGDAPPEQILQRLRAHAEDRRTALMLNPRDSLFDAIVHSQDIAVPLGREFPVPAQDTRRGLERVWQMGWPFRAQRRLANLKLVATDTDWAVGDGPEVTGPALSLLLLLTGRTETATRSLNGAGVAVLLR
jgi:uncharacterized protein (TIGR03083 family)